MKKSLEYNPENVSAIEIIEESEMIGYFAREGYMKIADINIEMVDWINNMW